MLALLFDIYLLTTSVHTSSRRVLPNGNWGVYRSITHFDNQSTVRILHVLIYFVFTSRMTEISVYREDFHSEY